MYKADGYKQGQIYLLTVLFEEFYLCRVITAKYR